MKKQLIYLSYHSRNSSSQVCKQTLETKINKYYKMYCNFVKNEAINVKIDDIILFIFLF